MRSFLRGPGWLAVMNHERKKFPGLQSGDRVNRNLANSGFANCKTPRMNAVELSPSYVFDVLYVIVSLEFFKEKIIF